MADTLRLLWTSSRDWLDSLRMWNVLNECHSYAVTAAVGFGEVIADG